MKPINSNIVAFDTVHSGYKDTFIRDILAGTESFSFGVD